MINHNHCDKDNVIREHKVAEYYIERSAAIILVGGRSRRMNYQDKMNLKIGEDSFLELIMKKLSFFHNIVISASQEQIDKMEDSHSKKYVESDMHIVGDKFYDVGPLGGMYSVMSEIEAEYFFVVSCDMPFISEEVIRELFSRLEEGDDAVIAVTNGRIQPVFSIYRASLKEVILKQIKERNYRILDFYDTVNTRYVEIDAGDTLRNINTIEEYIELIK